MAIQTDVTLQADYVLSACDGGKIPHCRYCYLITLPAYPSSAIVNTSCVNFFVHKVASLVVTAHYNRSVSEDISIFAAWSTGNDQAYRARRFGCREIKFPSAPIFFNTVYRHVVLLLLQMLF